MLPYSGISLLSKATGLSRTAIETGIQEVEVGDWASSGERSRAADVSQASCSVWI